MQRKLRTSILNNYIYLLPYDQRLIHKLGQMISSCQLIKASGRYCSILHCITDQLQKCLNTYFFTHLIGSKCLDSLPTIRSLISFISTISFYFPLRMATKDYTLVAAFDFGTTYSRYAFSFLHDYKTDPLKILELWWKTTFILKSSDFPTIKRK